MGHSYSICFFRYEFVDIDEDKQRHRPLLPREVRITVLYSMAVSSHFNLQEPKKMVRYRDGKVVSTKGERFTIETRHDKENDEMKKTFVSLKPLRKYRFH